jgi:undecaprenyl-diphosphatase
MLSYFQAIVMGLVQGVTELFPISSLGHAVLLPSLFGWDSLVRAQSADESFFLAFLVALHVATAIALLIYFRRDWVEIITAFVRTLRTRQVQTSTERLAWLIVVATVPVGVTGLLLEHSLRTVFAKPAAAAVFLFLNGLILLGGERARRRATAGQLVPAYAGGSNPPAAPPRRLDTLDFREAGAIGLAQTLALFAGISRSGITMIAGLVRGLDHEDAARFSFLMATPIIFAAGVYKLPDLFGPLGDGIRGQAFVGAVVAGIAAYLSVRFLMRFFQTRTLWPFGLYCLVVGGLSIIRFI